MKKLSLSLDDLEVDSFQTAGDGQGEGTVFGKEDCTCPTACSCPGCPTCDATCPETCEQTCNNTCWATCGITCGQDTCAYQLNPPKGPWYPCYG